MAIKSVNFLKTQNRDWDNVYDSFLSIAPKDNNTVQTVKGIKREVIAVNSTPFNAQVSSSGAIYVISSSAGALTFSLPPVVSSSGVTLTLITADNTSHIVSQSSNDSATGRQSKIYGSIQIVTGSTALAGSGSIPVLAQGKITFGSTNGIGQRLEFVGDGTHWYVKGFCNTAPTTAAK